MSSVVTDLAVAAKGNPELMLPLWEAVERLVRLWADQYARNATEQGNRLFDTDDLIQAGYLALVDAVAGYDPEAGAEFTTYLHYHVRKHFTEVSGHRGTKRRPEVRALSLDEPLYDEGDYSRVDLLSDLGATEAFDNVIEQIHNEQLGAALDECMETLPTEQAETLRSRYYRSKPLNVIAAESGTDPARVRRLEEKALRGMNRGKNAARLKEYREHIISRSRRYGSYRAFINSGYSSVEWAVERLTDTPPVEQLPLHRYARVQNKAGTKQEPKRIKDERINTIESNAGILS